VEGYLTTRGDAADETYAMIRDAGFEIEGNDLYARESASAANAHASAYQAGFRIPGGGEELLKPEIVRT
jgi:hypothetical protein